MVDVFSAGALTLAESSMEMPSIDDFLPPEILFQGTPFAINLGNFHPMQRFGINIFCYFPSSNIPKATFFKSKLTTTFVTNNFY